jgi:branched-chain amino acid transport system ATP-binding protein
MLLEVSGLSTGYGRLGVLYDVSVSVSSGEIVSILGPNGAGKSTLLRAISGLIPAWTGDVRLNDRVLGTMSPDKRAALGLGHLPEGRGILHTLSVQENLELSLVARNPATKGLIEADRDRLLHLFPILRDKLKVPAGSLSGGEQQMLALARAMMARPRILLVDEASFGLAPRLVADLFEQFRRFRDDGVGFLIVEQQAAVLKISDRTLVLKHGRVVASGAAAELADPEVLRRSYLGVGA